MKSVSVMWCRMYVVILVKEEKIELSCYQLDG